MRSSAISRLLLAAAFTLIAACSTATQEKAMERQIEKETGGNADVNINSDGSMHVETTEGTYDAGSNTLPAGWPADVPAYAGAAITFSASVNPQTGKPGKAVAMTTTDSGQIVLDFYKKTLVSGGWAIATSMQTADMNILSATKGDQVVTMMIRPADGQTMITIGVDKTE